MNDEWVPEQAYTTAHDFRKKYGSELTYDLVNVMLSDLNKIWRESVKKQLARVKNTAREEVNQLKRQLAFRAPYDMIQQKKTVAHMKT